MEYERTVSPDRVLRRLAPSLVAGLVIPLIVYLIARPRVRGDAAALALAGIVPAAWALGRLVWRRRIDPIAAASLTSLALALVVTVATRGNPLFLEIHEVPVTAAVGLTALVSVAVPRPLLAVVLRLTGRPVPVDDRRLAVATAIVGAALVVNACVSVTMAILLPVPVFVGLHRVVSLVVLGSGLGLLLLTRRRAERRRGEAASP